MRRLRLFYSFASMQVERKEFAHVKAFDRRSDAIISEVCCFHIKSTCLKKVKYSCDTQSTKYTSTDNGFITLWLKIHDLNICNENDRKLVILIMNLPVNVMLYGLLLLKLFK